MRYSPLSEVYEEIQNLLRHWKIADHRYSLEFRQHQLEIWSFDSDPSTGLTPCRFLITLTDETLLDPHVSTPEFYIDLATADDSYTYKVTYSPDRLVKMLVVLWEGQRNLGGLLHRSDKGFTKSEYEKKRRQ